MVYSVWDLYCVRAEPKEVHTHMHIHVQHEGGTILCTVKTMIQLTCTDRPYAEEVGTDVTVM